MTCGEVRSFLDDLTTALPSEVARHLELCAECRSLAHAQNTLAAQLQQLRDHPPEPSGALNGRVMAAYRRSRPRAPRQRRPLLVLGYVAVAAVVVFAVLWLGQSRHTEPPQNVRHIPAPAVVAHSEPRNVPPPVRVSTAMTPRPRKHKKDAVAPVPAPVDDSATMAQTEPPTSGFQSLMYCDPISCGGPMEMIRIQIPVSVVTRVPAPRPSNGFVQADVVVGSDGVARAIRIVH